MLTIKVAGLAVGIDGPDEALGALCAPYRCQEEPLFTVSAGPAALAAEAARSPGAPAWELRSLAVQRALCLRALEYGCILFHSSAVAADGRGYLFAAPSGTGKSTHARLWREMLGERAVMINDDKPLLRKLDGVWQVCGTPWNGKHALGSSRTVPIGGICFLERAERSEIARLSGGEAVPRLLGQMLRPADPAGMDRLLKLTESLLAQVPMWRLRCRPDRAAAEMSWRAMRE